jgi:hypothetical protein
MCVGTRVWKDSQQESVASPTLGGLNIDVKIRVGSQAAVLRCGRANRNNERKVVCVQGVL